MSECIVVAPTAGWQALLPLPLLLCSQVPLMMASIRRACSFLAWKDEHLRQIGASVNAATALVT